jgi:hypothetical protein
MLSLSDKVNILDVLKGNMSLTELDNIVGKWIKRPQYSTEL